MDPILPSLHLTSHLDALALVECSISDWSWRRSQPFGNWFTSRVASFEDLADMNHAD